MNDHNTRIIVFGDNGAQAREVATAVAKNAFSNVTFSGGSIDELRTALHQGSQCCSALVINREP